MFICKFTLAYVPRTSHVNGFSVMIYGLNFSDSFFFYSLNMALERDREEERKLLLLILLLENNFFSFTFASCKYFEKKFHHNLWQLCKYWNFHLGWSLCRLCWMEEKKSLMNLWKLLLEGKFDIKAEDSELKIKTEASTMNSI